MAGRPNADVPMRKRTRAPGGDDGSRKAPRGGLGFVAASDAPSAPGYSTASLASMFTPASVQEIIDDNVDDAPRGLGFSNDETDAAPPPSIGLSNAAFASMFTKSSATEETSTSKHKTVDGSAATSDAATMDDTSAIDSVSSARSGFSNTDFAAMFRSTVVDEVAKEEPVAQSPVAVEMPTEETLPQSKAPEPRRAPVLPPPNIASMGKWEKHTKGFGMKMLAKMGFKGRLGKDEQGIAVPIAVKARPNQLGLGHDSFREASTLAQNRQVERELHGKSIEDEEEAARKEQVFGTDDGAWRKRLGVPKPKRRRRTARDLVDDAPADVPRADIVIDMRGPSFDGGLSELQKQALLVAPVLGQELLYNLRTLVNEAESSVRLGHQRLTVERARLAQLQATAAATADKHHADATAQTNVVALRSALEEMHTAMASDAAPRAIERVADTLVSLRLQFPAEFEAHHIIDALPSLTLPLLKALAGDWDPLGDVDDSALRIKSAFDCVHNCLTRCVGDVSAEDQGLFAANVDTRHDRLYQHLCEAVVVPHVASALHRWDVRAPCVDLFAFLGTFVHPGASAHLLREGVLPKLKHEVRAWNPMTDSALLHEWLLPWAAKFSADEFDAPLYPLIREALSRALAQWHPSDTSIFPVLAPWQAVWRAEDFAVFTHKTIARKLLRCLNRELSLEPGETDVAPLEWTLAWRGVLPDRQLAALLEGEVFHKWLRVLRRWIERARAPDADRAVVLTEIITWFHGWKGFFAPVLHLDRVRLQFAMALQLLRSVEAATLPALDVLPNTYDRALVLGGKGRPPEPAPAVPVPNADVVHLRDVVEAMALEQGLPFVPHPKNHRVEGKPVFCLGKAHVYFEGDLVYHMVRKGEYEPVAIDALFRTAV
ncbi:STIP-like protein [Achlya hypogyna]|uniref:STIP-like protein n=1 Tax=Achlya hypogyna TaxID=1202772 RepID=A0A1V9YBP1_ACHHY|nr:STIP-like protein [Achlya hypogyna]